MSEIVCPYCFNRFERNKVGFRCRNTYCKTQKDEVLSRFWGDTQIVGRAIEAPGSILSKLLGRAPSSAKCPECGSSSYAYICPKCHNRIPNEMVRKKGHIISIIGARSSGKTIYITTLINELRNHCDCIGEMGISAENINDDPQRCTQTRYERDFFNKLYLKKECPDQTDVNDKYSNVPLIYELSNPKGDSIHLVFYDTAGENFANVGNIAGNVKFLQESDAVIFLLDTENIPYVHDKLGISAPIRLRYNVILDNVLTHFRESDPKTRENHFNRPIALVFSKIDKILNNAEKFEDTCIAGMSMASNSNYLDGSPILLSDFDSINVSMKGALSMWNENNFLRNIANYYQNTKFFGISALGSSPVNQTVSTIRPYRILDPLIWILHELGYKLPVSK